MTTLSIVHYRKFKNFCNDTFIKDITALSKLHSEENVLFKKFRESINKTLGKHAPLKKRYIRAHQSAFMNKKLIKEIMKGSRLRNKFLRVTFEKQVSYNPVLMNILFTIRNYSFPL